MENDSIQNLILVGVKGNPEKNDSKSEEYAQYLNMQIANLKTDKQVLTDDFAPIGN